MEPACTLTLHAAGEIGGGLGGGAFVGVAVDAVVGGAHGGDGDGPDQRSQRVQQASIIGAGRRNQDDRVVGRQGVAGIVEHDEMVGGDAAIA